MTTIPIADSAAERDIDRCIVIGQLSQALDNAALVIEEAAKTLAGILTDMGQRERAEGLMAPVLLVAAQSRKIAATARDSIA